MAIINEKTVMSLEHLVDELKSEMNENDKFIYRGQGNDRWELVTSFDRGLSGNPVQIENDFSEFFNTFKLEYDFRYGLNYVSENQLLTLAQHYGLKTRLLDWTTSPFIGVYFAVSSYLEQDSRDNCALFSFNRSAFEQQIAGDGLKIISEVADNNDRMRLQSGCLIRNESNFLSLEKFLNSLQNVEKTVLTKYVIDRGVAVELKQFLKLIRLNNESIFGGVESLAKDTNDSFL